MGENPDLCPVCGERKEDAHKGTCWTCHAIFLLAHAPSGRRRGLAWYRRAEKPVYDSAYGHSNATKLPATGWEFLDTHIPRFCDRIPPAIKNIPVKAGYYEGALYSGLTPAQHDAAVLYWRQGLTQEGVALVLGITQQSVQERLRGAAKKLGVPAPRSQPGTRQTERWDPADLNQLTPEDIKGAL